MGLRLRWCPSEWFTWSDLIAIYRYSDVNSNIYKSMHPDKADWTLTNHLLAIIADVLRWLQWARTKDGARNCNPPELIERPGVTGSRKAVHPNAKGLPRSKVRSILKPRKVKDKVQKITDLFSTGR